MSFTAHSCISISCDRCGEDLPIFEDVGTAHFDAEAEAVSAAAEIGWRIESHRHECERCGIERECREGRHNPATELVETPDRSFEVRALPWCASCHIALTGDGQLEPQTRIGGV